MTVTGERFFGKRSKEAESRTKHPNLKAACISVLELSIEGEPEGGGEGNSVAQMENGDGYGRAIHASRQSSRVKNPPGVKATL